MRIKLEGSSSRKLISNDLLNSFYGIIFLRHKFKQVLLLLWPSLIVQLVKNPPAMQETLVRFLSQEKSPGEGIGYPLQYSMASLVAQLVKNPPAMQETWV